MHNVRAHVEALRAAQAVYTGAVIVELRKISSSATTASHEAEQRDGQMFLYDIELRSAMRSGRPIENAVDYSQVAAAVREVAGGRIALLEALERPSRTCWSSGRGRAREGVLRKRDGGPSGIDVEFAAVTVER